MTQSLTKRFLILTVICSLLGIGPNSLSSAWAGTNFEYGYLMAPSSGGFATSAFCPSGTVAVGVQLPLLSALPDILQHVALKCLRIGGDSSSSFVTFVSQPPQNQTTQNFLCPTGSALVGFSATVGSYLRDLAPVCADMTSGGFTGMPTVGVVGKGTLNSKSVCPQKNGKPTFVMGLNGKTGSGVDALQVLCAPLNSLSITENLLGQYIPTGAVSTSSRIMPTNHGQIGLTELTVADSQGGGNTNVMPFRTSSLFDPTHYLQFTITPVYANNVQITRMSYSSRSYTGNSSSPTGMSASMMEIRSSRDNFSAPIIQHPLSSGKVFQQIELSPSEFARFPLVTTATTFRIYFYGGTGIQWNDLSGDVASGGLGLRLYGATSSPGGSVTESDSEPISAPSPTSMVTRKASSKPTPKPKVTASSTKPSPKTTATPKPKPTPTKATPKSSSSPTPTAVTSAKPTPTKAKIEIRCTKAGEIKVFNTFTCPTGWRKVYDN